MSSAPAEGSTGLPPRTLAGQEGQRSLCAQDQVSISTVSGAAACFQKILIETRNIEIFNEPLFILLFENFRNCMFFKLKAIVIEREIEMF